jgi:hypothetical protein
VEPAGRRRLPSWLRPREWEEDGVFRPVRLPLWTDLGISAGIVVVMAGSFGGFIYFLARTQER